MADETRFLFRGRFIEKEEARRRAIMVVGSMLPDERLAVTFDSDEEFHSWIAQWKFADKVYEVERAVERLRARRNEDHRSVQQRLKRTVERVTDDFNDLGRRHDLDAKHSGYELFRRATTERDPLEPPIFDPAVIWDLPGAKGSWLPLPTMVPFPDLRWFGWNDRASSLIGSGSGFLWQDPWFLGPRLMYYGYLVGFDLGWFGWDNRASSVMVA